MADNYLITGYHGEPHVTAENDRGFNAAVFGSGKFVLPVGEMLRAEYIGNNTVRVYDGKLLDGGALAGIPAGEYIDLAISEAGQGMKRNDIIVFQYSQDTNTLVESGTFVVISGTETSGTAVDPVLTENDILSGSATFDQMALWRVPVSGAVISAPESLFDVARNVESLEPYAYNLLDNSDFSNPVSSGTSGASSYSLDRWTANKLTIVQETHSIKTVPTATYAYIKQNVKVVPGRTYTCAARFSNAGVGEIRIYNTAITTQYGKVGKISVVGLVSFTVPDGVDEIAVLLYPNAANANSGIVYWAALYEGEYTAYTLPAYHPKGYGTELLNCGVESGLGADSEREWLNPPMLHSTAYRTTERYQGDPVYAVLVNLGALPNISTKTVEWYCNEGAIGTVFSVTGHTSDGGTLPYVTDSSAYNLCAYFSGQTLIVQVTTNRNKSSVYGYALVKFTLA